MKCTICNKEIELSPSAAERARTHGGVAADYIKLFTEHSHCALAKREADTLALMRRITGKTA